MKALTAWEWPGNVRELGNFVERAVILTRGRSLAAPLAELRKVSGDEPKAAAANHDDIARIVKETINALHGNSSATGDRLKNSGMRSCARSPRRRGEWAARTELRRACV